jgi:hypothetical protein
MKNKQRTTVAAILLLWLTSCATDADAACSHHKRVLKLGVNSIALEQKDTRCVLASTDGQSGTFDIRVKTGPGYSADLDAIAIEAKDPDGPVTFEVADVLDNKKVLVVLVTWDGSPSQSAEYGYTVTVPDLGVLDPKVQIIRTSPMLAYSTALQEFAGEYLDEAAYEYIVRELLPLEKQATSD